MFTKKKNCVTIGKILPLGVWEAYYRLVAMGFDKQLAKTISGGNQHAILRH